MDKHQFRKKCIDTLKQIPLDVRKQQSLTLIEKLLLWKNLTQFNSILGYVALPSEPNLQGFYEQCSRLGLALGFPKTQEDGKMNYWSQGERSVKLDPTALNPTLILVPALAFGPEGERLGRGGGYFDRFLLKYRRVLGKGAFFALGVTFSQTLFSAIPQDPWDQKVDAVVSEMGFGLYPTRNE